MLSEAAALIGDPQVRNYGTVVRQRGPLGSGRGLAGCSCSALGAEIKAVGPKGARTIKVDDFFKDLLFTTALGPRRDPDRDPHPDRRPRRRRRT